MTRTGQKPQLPAHFHDKSWLGTVGLVGTMLLYYVGGSAAAAAVWLMLDASVVVKLLLSAPLFVIAGQGMHVMGWIGHDGLHFNLSRNRHVSAVIGIFFSAMTVLFIEMGMALDHWTHHRFTNRPNDPDLKLFEKHQSFLARMVFTRARANRLYLRRTLRLVMGKPLDEELTHITFPFSLKVLRRYALFNLVCVAFWGAVYLAITVFVDWRLGVIGFLVPAIVASFLSGLRSYIEHNGTGLAEFHNTRTRASWFWTFMDLGANYHLEHHLYPSIAQWKLPALHRYLKAQGCYDAQCHIDHTILSHYRYASSEFVYPKASEAVHASQLNAAMY